MMSHVICGKLNNQFIDITDNEVFKHYECTSEKMDIDWSFREI